MPKTKRMRIKRSNRFAVFIALSFILGALPAIFNIYVDPYELIIARDRSGKVEELAEKAHYPLWKLGSYQRGQYDTVILGDSRARSLREKYWHSFGIIGAKNLAYGGGTIPEVYETFKLIRHDPTIKTLVVGIQLRSFDEDHKQGMNRVPEAISLINDPIEYVFNWSIAKTSLRIFRMEYPQAVSLVDSVNPLSMDAHASTPKPRKLPGRFQRQITRNAKSDWRGFEFSANYWNQILEIGTWAKDNNKTLIFVIPPTIVEMQQTIVEHGLSDINTELRKRLARLGLVLDFDFSSDVTKNISNFTDAYHFNSNVARQIVGEIVSAMTQDSKTLLRIEKRRTSLNCRLRGELDFTVLKHVNSRRPHEGRNCRYWINLVQGVKS